MKRKTEVIKRKVEVSIWKKKFIVREPIVDLYMLLLDDPDSFIEELFSEFNEDIPVLSNEQLITLTRDLFNTEKDKDFIEKILKEEDQDENKLNSDNFHIIIGRFMLLYPGNDYLSTIWMPFKMFIRLLRDYKKVTGEESEEDTKNKDKPDKKKLKNLLSKFS